MKRKVGINIESIGGSDAVELIADTGFQTVFTDKCDLKTVDDYCNRCAKRGLELEFLHAPFAGVNDMWLPGDGYAKIYGGMKEAVDSAAACGVGGVICHISASWFPPEICDIGLERYDRLVEYAGGKGVKIAFENLRKIGNVAYFADRYEGADNVVFCYDCGHEHCYTQTVCFPDIFRDRMAYTHIHDNFGRSKDDYYGDPDLHLMPFDGEIDYSRVVRKLDEYGYEGSLTLEVFNSVYPDESRESFIARAYDAIIRISRM